MMHFRVACLRVEESSQSQLVELTYRPQKRLDPHIARVPDDVGAFGGVFNFFKAETPSFTAAIELGLVVGTTFARLSDSGLVSQLLKLLVKLIRLELRHCGEVLAVCLGRKVSGQL